MILRGKIFRRAQRGPAREGGQEAFCADRPIYRYILYPSADCDYAATDDGTARHVKKGGGANSSRTPQCGTGLELASYELEPSTDSISSAKEEK